MKAKRSGLHLPCACRIIAASTSNAEMIPTAFNFQSQTAFHTDLDKSSHSLHIQIQRRSMGGTGRNFSSGGRTQLPPDEFTRSWRESACLYMTPKEELDETDA